MQDKIFYVYLDYTLEEKPRTFYVGKGNTRRVAKKTPRNKYWKHIAQKYGHRREVLLATKDEQYAFEMEIYNIRYYKTFEADWEDGSGWGANLTRGGEGSSGVIITPEHRQKLIDSWNDEKKQKASEKRRGIKNPQYGKCGELSSAFGNKYCLGKKLTDEQKHHLSVLNSGSNHPQFGKPGTMLHKKHSADSIEKMKNAHKGENNSFSKLNTQSVISIKQLLKLNISPLELANYFNVNRGTIYSISNNKGWKHISCDIPLQDWLEHNKDIKNQFPTINMLNIIPDKSWAEYQIERINRPRIHTEETKKKISDSNKNKILSEESLQNIKRAGESQKGKPKHTDEFKKLKSEQMSGINNPQYGKRGKLSPNFGKKGLNRPGESNPNAKLTMQTVLVIRERATKGLTYAEIAKEFNISRRTAYDIITRKSWKHI